MAVVLVEDDGRRLVKDTSYSIISLTIEKKETDALGNPSWRKEWSERVPTHLDHTLDRDQQLEVRPLSLLLRAISNHEAREARLQRSLDDAQSEVTLVTADLDGARAALAQADELIAALRMDKDSLADQLRLADEHADTLAEQGIAARAEADRNATQCADPGLTRLASFGGVSD